MKHFCEIDCTQDLRKCNLPTDLPSLTVHYVIDDSPCLSDSLRSETWNIRASAGPGPRAESEEDASESFRHGPSPAATHCTAPFSQCF